MKVLLVDDHVLFRAGLRLLLAALHKDIQILEAGICQEAFALLTENPDIKLCLLDLTLRNGSGFDAIASIREMNPEVAIVVVSGDEDPASIYRALDEGAMGYIPKSVTPDVMTHALKLVLAGGIFLPGSLLDMRRGAASTSPNSNACPPEVALTTRQQQVLQCLLLGWPNKLISRRLFLSENTIKTHLSAIFRTLNVTTRAQAVIAAGRLGIRANWDVSDAYSRSANQTDA